MHGRGFCTFSPFVLLAGADAIHGIIMSCRASGGQEWFFNPGARGFLELVVLVGQKVPNKNETKGAIQNR